MNVFRVLAMTDGFWQVQHYQGERLVGAIGPQVATEVKALFIAYQLARAEVINPYWQPVWQEPP